MTEEKEWIKANLALIDEYHLHQLYDIEDYVMRTISERMGQAMDEACVTGGRDATEEEILAAKIHYSDSRNKFS